MTSHSEVLSQLVRRGCHGAHKAMSHVPDMHKNDDGSVSPFTAGVIGLTIVVAFLLLSSFHYTMTIIKTLAMVEDTTTTYTVHQEKTEKTEKLLETDALAEDEVDDVIVFKNVAITSKISTTIRHLQKRAGFRARWRGLRAMMVYGLSYALLNGALSRMIYSPVSEEVVDIYKVATSRAVSSLVSRVALAMLSMTWTHIVISEPSSKAWFQRIPSVSTWKKVAGATAINAACRQFAFALPAFLFFSMELNNKALYTEESLRNGETRSAIIKLMAITMIGVVAFVGITIPSDVALVRVQASMLPETDDTVVPFDRTFGGRVASTELGGSGCIGYFDAWRTMDRSARLRLIKLYVKVFALEACLHGIFAYMIATEIFVLAGPAVARFIESRRHSGGMGMGEVGTQ